MEVALLLAVAAGTVLATGLGALPVLRGGVPSPAATAALWGFAGGVMAVAAVAGLLAPAARLDGTVAAAAWAASGAAALLLLRGGLGHREVRLGVLRGASARRGALVVATLAAHSLPEGFALGAAWAGGGAAGVLVVVAIALQNLPEGTVAAIPLRESGAGRRRTFLVATATSAPQVPGALLAFLAVEGVDGLLAPSYAVAAGAMLALVVREIAPAARPARRGALGAGTGAAVALLLGALAGV